MDHQAAELDVPIRQLRNWLHSVQEVRKKKPSDFTFGKLLGEGSYAQVCCRLVNPVTITHISVCLGCVGMAGRRGGYRREVRVEDDR